MTLKAALASMDRELTEQGIRREERRVLMAAGADPEDGHQHNPQMWNPPNGEGASG